MWSRKWLFAGKPVEACLQTYIANQQGHNIIRGKRFVIE